MGQRCVHARRRARGAVQGAGAVRRGRSVRCAGGPAARGDGDDTSSTQNRYTLTFPAGQLQPVNAFWSLTAYDEHGFLIPNTPRRLLHRPPLSRTHCGTDVVRSRPPGTGRCFLAVRSPGPGGKDNPP
ncbi:DUF1214 domain-containing protein [Streptomyces clavuligerus]|uniref:DUF1214 domain-containing protein n=1 Tax=Streptomyces clavuligerus TaxID=1901 RepID=UPI000998614F|nr:DUF1214 domain-containing protein [Streptomyces clavuligerus]WDN57641.1 DUF1214 domain-containing protein [Streptomyces clavuligerus]